VGVRHAYAQATGPTVTVTPTAVAPTSLGSCTLPIAADASSVVSEGRSTADATFQVDNIGTIPVTLQGVTSDNPAITIVGPSLPQSIDPGKLLVVQVRLTCTATGAQNAVLTLDVQSAVGPVTAPTVSVQGTCGLRGYTLSPNALDFGAVMPGSTEDRITTLRSTGTETLSVLGFTLGGTDFSVVSPTPSAASPLTLPANQTVDVTVRLTCPLGSSPGTRSDSLGVTATAGAGPLGCDTASLQGMCATEGCSVTPSALNFGNVQIGATKDLTFTIENTGSTSFDVTGLTPTDNHYTIVGPSLPVTVPAGGSTTVTVRLTCSGMGGTHTGQIDLAGTTAFGTLSCGPVTVTGACGTEGCSITPSSLDFGVNPISSTKDLTFTIDNTGTVNLTITGLTPTDANYSIVGPALPVTIAAGASQTVTVRLTCPSTSGTSSGQIDITGTSPFGATNCGPVPVTGRCEIAGCLVTPTALDFGQTIGAGTTDLTFMIENTGTIDLDVTGLALSGATDPAYSIVSPTVFPVTITPGGSTTVTVRLTCDGMTAGTPTGQVDITSSTALGTESCGPVTLTGVCDLLDCDVSPMSLDFGDLGFAGTGDMTFTITNTGTIAFTVTGFVVTDSSGDPFFAPFTVISPMTPFTLNGGEFQVVTVRAECAGDFPGMHTGSVAIAMTSPSGPVSCGPVSLAVTCGSSQAIG
jgi:hypothetical protein